MISIAMISRFFDGSSNLLQRGENAVKSKHVKTVAYNEQLGVLKGEVFASMKSKIYKVEINFNVDGYILNASCACPRGNVLCHHMAALLIFARENISVTDKECSWSVRKTQESEEVLTCTQMNRKTTYSAISNKTSIDVAINELKRTLIDGLETVGFAWLVTPDKNIEDLLCVDIEEILFSKEYQESQNKNEFFQLKCALKEKEINFIQNQTIGQSKNENWLVVRKNRLTASRFGLVLQACRRNKYPPSLFKTLFELFRYFNFSQKKVLDSKMPRYWSHSYIEKREQASFLKL